jgi:hypothetical protein
MITWKQAVVLTAAVLTPAVLAQTVKVSDFKPDRADATAALQAAIDSGAKVVLVDDPGFEYLVETITFKGDQEVVFQDNVRVRAMPGKFLAQGASLFRIQNVSNLVVRGEGKAELTMNKADYQDASRYQPAEWRHAISMRGSEQVVIRDLTISNSGGDGIYLGAPGCKDVHLENLVLTDHHRQGISVISAENLLVRNCKLINTSGTPPAAGIDFEPNHVREFAVNCVLENCDIYGNQSYAVHFAIPKTLERPISIVLRDCRIYDNGGGVHFNAGGGYDAEPLQGTIDLIRCTISTPRGSAVTLLSHRVGGVRVRFQDCVIDNRANPKEPFLLATKHLTDIAGIDLGNTVVLQDVSRPVFLIPELGAAGLQPIGGSLTIRGDDGQEQAYDLAALAARHPGLPAMRSFASAPLDLSGWRPAAGATGKAENPVLIRRVGQFAQYATAGQTIDITFQAGWARGPVKFPVKVFSPSGKQVKEVKAEIAQEGGEYVLPLAAAETGVHVLEFATGAGIKVMSAAPGHGFLTTGKGLSMFRCNSNLYFNVPADVREVAIEVIAEVGESLAAELYDEAGVVRASQDSFVGTKYLVVPREPSARMELWRLKLFKVVEDHYIRLGAPLPPIVFTDPANRLLPE